MSAWRWSTDYWKVIVNWENKLKKHIIDTKHVSNQASFSLFKSSQLTNDLSFESIEVL